MVGMYSLPLIPLVAADHTAHFRMLLPPPLPLPAAYLLHTCCHHHLLPLSFAAAIACCLLPLIAAIASHLPATCLLLPTLTAADAHCCWHLPLLMLAATVTHCHHCSLLSLLAAAVVDPLLPPLAAVIHCCHCSLPPSFATVAACCHCRWPPIAATHRHRLLWSLVTTVACHHCLLCVFCCWYVLHCLCLCQVCMLHLAVVLPRAHVLHVHATAHWHIPVHACCCTCYIWCPVDVLYGAVSQILVTALGYCPWALDVMHPHGLAASILSMGYGHITNPPASTQLVLSEWMMTYYVSYPCWWYTLRLG